MGFEDKFNKNCTHKLVYDYGYVKEICYRQHTITSKEESTHRNLRCIQCGKDLKAKKCDEMFNRIDGIIKSDNVVTYVELFNLYEEESKNNEENECIENIKKKVYKM